MTDRHFLCLRPVHQCTCFGEPHNMAGHTVITSELVRLTLGGKPERPELVTTPTRGQTTPSPRYHSRHCMDAWMLPCQCGLERRNGVVRGGLSRVGDGWLRRWVWWVLSRNVRVPGPSQAWLDRNPDVEV